MKKALIVEDDPNIQHLLEIHLKDIQVEVTKCSDGREGLQKALGQAFDLIVLDIMLPGMDGMEICRRIRAKENNTPIIMLTAKSEEIDKVLGLETGADDYLTKPFSFREFVARVKAIFRRTSRTDSTSEKKNQVIRSGDLTIDLDKRKVTRGENRLELSKKEFDLLALLASNPGKSYTRTRILNLVWGYEFEGYEHTVNAHINRLRSKIEPDHSKPRYILTSWGVGYRFTED